MITLAWFMVGYLAGQYVIIPMLAWIAAGLRAVMETGLRECPDCGQYHR